MRQVRYLLILSILLLCGGSALAGGYPEFCGEHNYRNGDQVSVRDLREMTMPASGVLTVDGRENGGISVRGENRSDIQIRACLNAWADTKEKADAAAKNTRISTGSVVKAENSDSNAKFSVSYEILVPKSTSVKLTAHNGGIAISGVEGNLEFETHNGGVSLQNVGGSVKGMTKNGGVSVKLAGSRFNGSGLDVETQNGGVQLSLPSNYAANIETGTVNGGLRSDFKELRSEKSGRWYHSKQFNVSINGGGPKIRVVTTNGGVSIKSSSEM